MGALGGKTVPGTPIRIRRRFLRSIRMRILLPVLIASLGVVGLGAAQTSAALAAAARADRARTLATASGQIVTFAHELAEELVAAGQLRRSGSDPSTFEDQVTRTQRAEVAYAAALSSLSVTTLGPLIAAASTALDGVRYVRTVAPDGGASQTTITIFYSQALESVLAIANAVPGNIDDAHLVAMAKSVALLGELDLLSALQLDLVADAVTGHALAPHDARQLAEWVGQERAQTDLLAAFGPAGQRYTELMNAPGPAQAYRIRQNILDDTQAALNTDPAIWYADQSDRRAQLAVLRTEIDTTLHRDAAAAAGTRRLRVFQTAGLSAGLAALTLVVAMRLAARTGRRLQRTRRAALAAARIELPAAITKVVAARDADDVRSALTESWARIDAMLTTGTDEIGELASAFGAVHRQALHLAADQALLRMEVQALFVALSRRGQTLVQRQIHLIDEFGRDEIDPEALSRLFALDHLAARMRRNEENLLVLAGGEPGRWITRPVAVVDVIRAAAQEIEDYQRVELGAAPPVAVAAHVAGDIIHLLAELIENATAFSPPSATVRVSAIEHGDGLAITVVDQGIGMPEVRLVEANERLSRPSALTSTLVGTMGLLVVARLAERHRIGVRLVSTRARGTTATVALPQSLLAAIPPDLTAALPPDHTAALPPDHTAALPPNHTERAPSRPDAPQPLAAALVTAAPTAPPSRPRRLGTALPVPPAQRILTGAATNSPEVTRAGLPRRQGQDSPPPDDSAISQPPPPVPESPDPATIQARLASLAGGIAAAQRSEPGSPVAHPSTEDSP